MKDKKGNLAEIFREQKPRSYKKGQIVIRPDDVFPGIFYVDKGFVKAYSLTEQGEQKNHIIYKKGDVFPLVNSFASRRTNAFFETVNNSSLRKIEYDEFIKLIRSDNDMLLDLTRRISDYMRIYIERIDGLEYTKARSRIIDHLLFLSERFGKANSKQIIIEVPITHKDIADSTAVSRETVSREMEKLKKDKLIQNKNKFLVIVDLNKLERQLLLQSDSKRL
ncbi:Crp/Fnr family transcriptional regulator [Patescibacteria group bacterium]|nr:Crp/Fnr family transcriptional regulator [Patescibacteria group bacterium]